MLLKEYKEAAALVSEESGLSQADELERLRETYQTLKVAYDENHLRTEDLKNELAQVGPHKHVCVHRIVSA